MEATLSEVGTTGLCYAEPLVDIAMPGLPRVLYANVHPDRVAEMVASHVKEGKPKPRVGPRLGRIRPRRRAAPRGAADDARATAYRPAERR